MIRGDLEMELIATSIKGLDEEIGGGIPKGSIILLSGTPGTYKSSVAYSMLYNAAITKNTMGIFLLLEQSMKSLLSQQERMERPMDERVQKNMIVSDVGRIRAAAEKFSTENDWMHALRSYVEYLVEKRKAELLVIDSLLGGEEQAEVPVRTVRMAQRPWNDNNHDLGEEIARYGLRRGRVSGGRGIPAHPQPRG